ncbi:DUF7146 domain-containing protein [Leptospirillum ferriphilum]|uniref:Uncharacterized protein n=1 Tax=Leptospirillum ferriphilum (strain ML-04) TaxID=1048260 RepID=J9Z879_LEPFM|nr:hypothetical protein LFML04_0414 [Leptospirillum ferriphilum ML-04]
MTACDLASCLEGRKEGREWRCRCPVHGGRSLSVTERDGRLLVMCRAGCSQEVVIQSLKREGLWENGNRSEAQPSPSPEKVEDIERKAQRASRIWAEAAPLQPGDAVWTYLKGRGITLDRWPEDLRTHAGLDYWEVDDAGKPVRTGVFPCMLAVIRNPEGRPVGIHRTWVNPDGSGKAPVPSPKKILKVHDLTGSAVRIFPLRDGLLAVCEGIEDALSAWILWHVPTWACLGTSGMKSFEPPAGIRELIIFADRDVHGAGQKAALALAKKLKKEMAVSVRLPAGHAKDINQLLREGALHAV